MQDKKQWAEKPMKLGFILWDVAQKVDSTLTESKVQKPGTYRKTAEYFLSQFQAACINDLQSLMDIDLCFLLFKSMNNFCEHFEALYLNIKKTDWDEKKKMQQFVLKMHPEIVKAMEALGMHELLKKQMGFNQ